MARVARLTRYPVKALSGADVETVRVTEGGTLAGDREYRLVDADGDPVNGKRTPRVHDLDTAYDSDSGTLAVETSSGETATLPLRDRPSEAAAWLGGFFDCDLTVERDTELGFVDRRSAGPSVISTATLEAVADWFDDLTVQSVRRRMRANVEVAGVPAFWEDRFVGPDAPAFRAGDVRFEGVQPCGRCVVPERDPDTGERDPGFRERFVERREATLPDWVDREAFDHYYALMLIADVPEDARGRTLAVGDGVAVE
ncbi:MOSC domain-containing protein [Salarchaeum sp. JOR-1]|uniref:MOSC domain-containing protein n=1 Tax=Salarchaeum sp. JOR-1 TaxID=2599399 RepID=UPI0011988556|nr:MOSC N-terminal beta barrel domain-containing protein [Salarchaeum sp. JOR-1]QDX41104.1 MOSC domain-containing protein [Salarchaeum sp. JOR-1]